MIWKCNQVKAAGHAVDSFSPPNSVVLYYKNIALGHMSMKRMQRQATDWQKNLTIDRSNKELVSSEMQMTLNALYKRG